jgi:hypothetical protein
MQRSNRTTRQVARLAVLAATAALLGGCGWTARDEFFRSRAVVFDPQAGDGSQITSTIATPGTTAGIVPQVAEMPGTPATRNPH